jgi:hypothetical protein
MSVPTVPNISPEINLPRHQVINLLLASIAFEELGLAHLINAEAEKIQSVLGTLHKDQNTDGNNTVNNPSVEDLERIDKVVRKVLQDIIKKEMLLQFKLENVLQIPDPGELG